MLAVMSFPSLQDGVDDTLPGWMAQNGGSMGNTVSGARRMAVVLDQAGMWKYSHLHFTSYPRLSEHLLPSIRTSRSPGGEYMGISKRRRCRLMICREILGPVPQPETGGGVSVNSGASSVFLPYLAAPLC